MTVISDELNLNGIKLLARFQPYHRVNSTNAENKPATHIYVASGELLTHPQGIDTDIESFFTKLTLEENFKVLEWHLGIAEQLSKELNIHTSINLHNSLVQFDSGRSDLLQMLSQVTTSLTFEFTETFPMPEKTIANQLLRDIRKLGHLTALDDFGTGLNGMSLLTDCDFDIIKIDRVLTIDLKSQPEKRKMMALTLKMLNVLGREHVVEGIEDPEVYEILLEIGFKQFQGFLFGQPENLKSLSSKYLK